MKSLSLVLLFGFLVAVPLGYSQQSAQQALHPVKIKIALIGDSTQTRNTGYGFGFCANLTNDVTCVNDSKDGASIETYIKEGDWEKALAEMPDYMLIQFAHNDDETVEHQSQSKNPQAEYSTILKRFVEQALEHGIVPVLITPLAHRNDGADGRINSRQLADSEALKKVAREKHTPLVDLQAESIAYLDMLTEAQGQALGITKKDGQGNTIPDTTHLNYEGSYVFGRMVAVNLGKVVPALAAYVKPTAAPLPPEGVRSLSILRGASVRIVLVGDSTVNINGGWGPGFCALMTPNVECINEASSGRSSKSYYDEGLWQKALARHGDYILIQFGHNDQPGKGPERETDPDTTYAANMRRYIEQARAAGARPVIVTSLSRRNYKDGKLIEDLTAYASAARRVAVEEDVPLIDLNAYSTKLLESMTQQQADQFDATAHPDASASGFDRTHLNPVGSAVFGRMVADELARQCVELGPDIKGKLDVKSISEPQSKP